jgi:hypothetical protein
MSARDNKWLKVQPGVVLTETIDPVIMQLDEWFKKDKLTAYVTSGLRDPTGQLDLIKSLAKKCRIDLKYPEITTASLQGLTTFDENGHKHTIYLWQRAWSALLNVGIIVNPPLRATVLFDYWRDGMNKKGMEIGGSPHFKGTAFDIGGNTNGIEDEFAVMKDALVSGTVDGLKGILIERQNNCCHCDCILVT